MEELVKRARELDIDIEDLIITAISRSDPSNGLRLRLELARRYLNEAEDYVRRNDPVQASERAYKAAGEVVKALAEIHNLPEHQEALREGRWYTYMLFTASSKLSERVGEWVSLGWNTAYSLHVWGFHEAKLSTGDVEVALKVVKRMVDKFEGLLKTKE